MGNIVDGKFISDQGNTFNIVEKVCIGTIEKHLINLVWSKDEEGKYILNLRHNGFGEVITDEDSSHMTISGASYVSFPIADIITEEKATIVLNWKWYEKKGDMGYDYKKEKDYSYEFEWERKGFIQLPARIRVGDDVAAFSATAIHLTARGLDKIACGIWRRRFYLSH